MKQGERFLRDEPEKYLAVKEGWVLGKISFTLKEDEWTMLIAITDKRGNHMVAFIGGSQPYDCWEYLYKNLTTTAAPLRWMTDKYYKR